VTQRLDINAIAIAWHERGTGDGVPLVLCHGYTGSSYDFSLHLDALARLTGRRVIALDQRGHGESTHVGRAEGYTIDHLVADLEAFLDAVSPGPVDLLGHSMGGRVCQLVTLRRPERVRSLILMDTSAWSFVPEDEGVRQLLTGYLEGFDPSRGMPQLGLRGPEDDLIDTTTSAGWRAGKDRMYAGMDAYAMKALGQAILTQADAAVRPRLPTITCPTTVLVGSLDHPFIDQAPELAAELGNGRLAVIAGAFHSPQLTHQEEWRAAVADHLTWAAHGAPGTLSA